MPALEMGDFPLILPGKRRDRRRIEVRSPYSGAVVATVERATVEDIEEAKAIAAARFRDTMRPMPAHRRAAILEKLADLIAGSQEELAQTIASEGGKPIRDARVEVSRAVNTVKISAREALSLDGEAMQTDKAAGSEDRFATIFPEPIGVVAAISAFNHPVNLIAHQVAPAIAAGCPVIVKPATDTPVSAIKVCRMLLEAGLPEGCVTVIVARPPEAEAVAVDRRVNYVSFIGSHEVGWPLRGKIHPGTRIGLELGGTAPVIVQPDANIEEAIPLLVRGGYYHAGQVCISVQRLYVHEEIFAEFSDRFVKAAGSLVTGDPTSDRTDVGPLIRQSEVERVSDTVESAMRDGAKAVIGAKRLDNNCYAPTVLTDVSPGMDAACKEIFGPVVSLIPHRSLDEAISAANATPFGFQSAIFTARIRDAIDAARRLNATVVTVNDPPTFRVDWMPFGGREEAGLGVGGVKYTVREMTQEKLVTIRP